MCVTLCHVEGFTSKSLRYSPCVTRRSHSFTNHPQSHTRTIPAFIPQQQGDTALWLVLTAPTHEGMARLSWPGWLLTYRDNCLAPGIEPGHGHPSKYLPGLTYCKTLFFHRILILRFHYVENLLHFNSADFPVNFIKQFVSCFFWYLKQMLLSKFIPYYCLHYIIPRILHIISRICSANKIMVMGNNKNSRVFNFAILLKLRKFDAREIHMFYSSQLHLIETNTPPQCPNTTIHSFYCICRQVMNITFTIL